MAFVLSDRVRETSTAPGTGSFTVNGAVQGAQSFASVLTSNGDTTWYAATNGTAWETGLLTRTSATVYARTTIFASSNAGAAVNFASGTVDVFCDLPGSKAKVLERLAWAAAAITPVANDGTALGTAALQFSDLFLAEGAVINFDNGDVTITQTGNVLAFAGASTRYDFDAALAPTAAPGTAVSLSGASSTVSIGNGSNAAIASTAGIIIILESLNGTIGVFNSQAGSTSDVNLGVAGIWSSTTTTPGAGHCSLAFSAGAVRIFNNLGSTVVFKVIQLSLG